MRAELTSLAEFCVYQTQLLYWLLEDPSFRVSAEAVNFIGLTAPSSGDDS